MRNCWCCFQMEMGFLYCRIYNGKWYIKNLISEYTYNSRDQRFVVGNKICEDAMASNRLCVWWKKPADGNFLSVGIRRLHGKAGIWCCRQPYPEGNGAGNHNIPIRKRMSIQVLAMRHNPQAKLLEYRRFHPLQENFRFRSTVTTEKVCVMRWKKTAASSSFI